MQTKEKRSPFTGIFHGFCLVLSHLPLFFQSPRTPIFNNSSQWLRFCKKGNKKTLGGSLGNLGIGVSIRIQTKILSFTQNKLSLIKRLYIYICWVCFFSNFRPIDWRPATLLVKKNGNDSVHKICRAHPRRPLRWIPLL